MRERQAERSGGSGLAAPLHTQQAQFGCSFIPARTHVHAPGTACPVLGFGDRRCAGWARRTHLRRSLTQRIASQRIASSTAQRRHWNTATQHRQAQPSRRSCPSLRPRELASAARWQFSFVFDALWSFLVCLLLNHTHKRCLYSTNIHCSDDAGAGASEAKQTKLAFLQRVVARVRGSGSHRARRLK